MFNKLYFKRVCRRLTQQELALMAGISRRTVVRLENGDSMPTLRVAVKLCRALECPLEEVFPSHVYL